MSRFQYLALGYALIWVTLAVYMISLHRKTERLRSELDEMRRRVGAGPR